MDKMYSVNICINNSEFLIHVEGDCAVVLDSRVILQPSSDIIRILTLVSIDLEAVSTILQ